MADGGPEHEFPHIKEKSAIGSSSVSPEGEAYEESFGVGSFKR